MTSKPLAWLALLLLCTAALSDARTQDGISGTGIAYRSIVIDGVRYETDNAVVRANGEPTTIDELKVGHRVFAVVDPVALEALEIDQYDAVVGKVEEVHVIDDTLNAWEFVVLGQTIRTSMDTVLHVDDKEFEVKKGKRVAINGPADANGIIHATSYEEADGHEDLIVTGVVDSVDGFSFTIGALRIESPYHGEYVQEGWLKPGATVQARGEDEKDGVLEATRVIPVPEDLVTLTDENFSGTSDSWVQGEVEWIDAGAGLLRVNGVEIELDPGMLMLDQRDEVRGFDVEQLELLDPVEVVLRRAADRPRATKLVRKKKVKILMRSPLQGWDEFTDSVTLLDRTITNIDDAEIKYRGKKLKVEELRDTLGPDDALLLEWDKKGKLKKLRIVSDSERWSRFWKPDKGD